MLLGRYTRRIRRYKRRQRYVLDINACRFSVVSIVKRIPLLPLLAVSLATLICCGCDRSSKTDQAGQPSQASAPESGPGPTDPEMQNPVARIEGIHLEPNPDQRPMVLSERAANRREWALRALLKGYEESGHASPKWDEPARAALSFYCDLVRLPQPSLRSKLVPELRKTQSLGCTDPMIQYLQARYEALPRATSKRDLTLACLEAHDAIVQSRHHPLFKFLVGLRALQGARELDPKGNRSARLRVNIILLQDVVRDTNAPAEEVFDQVIEWTRYIEKPSMKELLLTNLMPMVELNWTGHEPYHRWRGMLETDIAWAHRGRGFAHTVTDDGWKGFVEHLAIAEKHLNRAWQLNNQIAHTAYLMVRVELGQGKGDSRMRIWFDRAMALDPQYVQACDLMSFYLEPRWHGSEEACLNFARSCVKSTKWNGEVPLVLPRTHRSLAVYREQGDDPAYWHRPAVWRDVHEAFNRFFELNPKATAQREEYAFYAYLCGQYPVFLEQARLMSSTNHTTWGSPDKFAEKVARATAAVSARKS